LSKYIFYDLETTGFSRQWEFIIEVAAVLYDTEEEKELDVFNEFIKPEKKISAKITDITGITNKMVANARSEEEVLMDFLEWVQLSGADAVVGHNIIAFDNDFVKKRSARYGLPMFKAKEFIDTLKIARKKKIPVSAKTATGRPSYKQVSLAEHYGIVYDAHRAIEDVRANIKILSKMTGRQEIERKRDKYGF
jgi:DNA polymerase III alpha subunit (gram-positive type)